MHDDRLLTSDGYSLAVRRFEPTDAGTARPRVHAVAIIASALGVDQRFYAPFARWLSQHGIAVYTFDYRGVGASGPPDGKLRGFQTTIDEWAEIDCAALIDDASKRHPRRPVYWIGHSLGAQIFGLVPNHDRVQAMLSVAAGSGYYRYNARPLRYYVLSLWRVIMPLALKVAGYFPGSRLRMVGDLPRGVAEQWRRWCLAPDYLGVEGAAVREKLARVEVPVTALSVQDDEMMTLRGTQALFALYSGARVEIRRVRPNDHGLRSIGHFGFFRPRMEHTMWPMVLDWMGIEASRSVAETAHL